MDVVYAKGDYGKLIKPVVMKIFGLFKVSESDIKTSGKRSLSYQQSSESMLYAKISRILWIISVLSETAV